MTELEKKINVLHIVGGKKSNGVFKGAYIFHEALLGLKINSKILNDENNKNIKNDNFVYINKNLYSNVLKNFFILIEKTLKTIFLHSPRETFTFNFFGFDLTKIKAYKEADIIHIHWLGEGFINLRSISKIKKPVVWTIRDMWPFTGGSHYTMDFEKYERGFLAKFVRRFKKNCFKKNIHFVTTSKWMKRIAEQSEILKNKKITQIDNNIDLKNFNSLSKDKARNNLKISTKKKIILYGAQNPQSKRKGWDLFIDTLRQINKKEYFLLIFGKFWSHEVLDEIGIEYKSMGFINETNLLNEVYSSADLFVASSIHDAWPKTFAEAMYCGTPVVCFDNTSISEIVDHKKSGYVVNDFSSDGLKKGIEWLANEVDKNSLINKYAVEKILNYDPTIIASKYVKIYNQLI